MSNFAKNKCPFCGSEGTIFTDSNYSEKVSCTNINCPLHSKFIELKDWNNRPIENELKEQIKGLKKLINQMNEEFLAEN